MNGKLKAEMSGWAAEGIRPDALLDFDALLELERLGDSILGDTLSPDLLEIIRPSISVRGLTFWRLSHGAKLFVQDSVSVWYEIGSPIWTVAIAFVLHFSRNPEKLWALADRESFSEAVRIFWKGLPLTDAELAAVFRELTPQGITAPEDPDPARRRKILPIAAASLGVLSREYGISPGDAIWRLSEGEIALLLEEHSRNEGGSSAEASDPDSIRIRRLREWFEKTSALKARILSRG